MEQVDPVHLLADIDKSLAKFELAEKNIRENAIKEELSIDEKTKSWAKHIAQLHDTKKDLLQDLERQDTTIKELKEKVSELKEKEKSTQLSEIKWQSQRVIKTNADLEAKLNEKRRLLEQQRAENTLRKSSAEENNEKLKTEVHACVNQLQLDISPAEKHHIRFTFKCISSTDINKSFSFVLYLEESGTYIVTECEPRLPELDSLVSDLNVSRQLYNFVKLMRIAFVNYEKKQNSL